jgi:hypothetical protein
MIMDKNMLQVVQEYHNTCPTVLDSKHLLLQDNHLDGKNIIVFYGI